MQSKITISQLTPDALVYLIRGLNYENGSKDERETIEFARKVLVNRVGEVAAEAMFE